MFEEIKKKKLLSWKQPKMFHHPSLPHLAHVLRETATLSSGRPPVGMQRGIIQACLSVQSAHHTVRVQFLMRHLIHPVWERNKVIQVWHQTWSLWTIGKKKGRPRKELLPPTDDDFPHDGTEEEKKRYKNRKKIAAWHYKQNTGPDAAEHRRKENERSKQYYRSKKLKEETENEGKPEDAALVDKKEKKKPQNRVR